MALKYLYAPSGYKAGKTYGILPNTSSADLAFSRNSKATRVNSTRLIDKGESISSNDFAPSNFSSGWTGVGSGMTLSTGAAVFNKPANGDVAYIRTNNNITSGVSYRIVIVVTSFTSAPQGSGLNYYHNSGSTIFPITGVGTYEYRFTAKSTDLFFLDSNVGTSLTLGSVSIREITTTNLNTPRLDYTDGSNPTLLVEPSRTNLTGYSARGAYGNYPASITQTLAPDGTNMATIPTPDAVADRYNRILHAATYTTGTKITYSWYRKRLSTPVISTYTGDLHIQSLINCTQVGNTIQIETNINGYDRFSATFNLDFSLTSGYTNAYIRGYFGGIIGVGNSSIAYFGHQAEVGEYATSYIPTSGGAITRVADTGIISGDLSSYINSSEGVLEARFKPFPTDNPSGRITLAAANVNNRISLGYLGGANDPKPFLLIKDASGAVDEIGVSMPSSFNLFDYNTYKFKFKSGNNELKINGELVDTDTDFKNFTFTFSSELTNISLNIYGGSTLRPFYGKIKYIKVYDSITDF